MDLTLLKNLFLITEKEPSPEDLLSKNGLYALPLTINSRTYWIIIRDNKDSILLKYLLKNQNYKDKEKLFGLAIDKGYAYLGGTKKPPEYMQLVLPKKWEIKDKNISRKLDVVITNVDQKNKTLLHELYKKVRSNK